MVKKYRLNRVSFKNFKLFDEQPFSVNFNANDLVVLDGPNGYGKTTVYDAIELALTGSIRRLRSLENKQIPSDVVVAHKNRPECEVSVSLSSVDSEKVVTIIRRLKNPLPAAGTKISKFDQLWDIVLLSDSVESPISQDQLNKIVDSDHLLRDFSLFHYVEQEDTAHFLKSNNEVDRAKALSKLFGDTKEMQQRLDKVVWIEKLIVERIKSYKKIKNQYEVQYGFVTGGDPSITQKSFEHKVLIPWREQYFEWDQGEISGLTPEKKDDFLRVLSGIKSLARQRESFLTNRKYRMASQQTSVLKAFVMHYKYLGEIESLKKILSNKKTVDSSLEYLKLDSLDRVLERVVPSGLFSIIGYQQGAEFVDSLKEFLDFRKINSSSSSLYNKLIEYRDNLHEQFHKVDNADDNCPYCGTGFDDHDGLINAINDKGDSLRDLLSDDERRVIEMQDQFSREYLNPVVELIASFNSLFKAPSDEHMNSLESAFQFLDRFKALIGWLTFESITFEDLLLEYSIELPVSDDVDKRLEELRTRILSKSPEVSQEYIEADSLDSFETVFDTYFDRDSEALLSIEVDHVDNKINYILGLYSSSISVLHSEYKQIGTNIFSLEGKKSTVSDIKKKIKLSISGYQKKLIRDIEIPFYIYSGKVLQTHQSGIGNGIFIKDKTGGEELKNIRFVSDWESDHDILNTMSSGQIAAVVITLYLALNKVYCNGLRTILIDDPVQTMDEINMISLVELLRNEFSDRQIILSTHEDHVTKYFLYKFLKYGRSVRQINMMDRKEYQLSATASKKE